jgi:hypothetical protein
MVSRNLVRIHFSFGDPESSADECMHRAVWFKVDQAGKAADGTWAATTGLYKTNSVYTFKIPSTLPAGQYIIRHEM